MKEGSEDRNKPECRAENHKLSLTRRQFVTAAGAGLVASGLPFLMAARNAAGASSPASAPPDLAAARKEGPLLL